MIRRIEPMLRPPGFLSVVEAAQGSGSDPVYLYRAAVSGALPCVFGGLVGLVGSLRRSGGCAQPS